MTNITPFLAFNDQAEEAARFYTSIFPNSKVTNISYFPDLGPDVPFKGGSVMMVAFTLNGRAYLAMNGGPGENFKITQAFSFSVLCDTQEEVDRYWSAIENNGGTPVACGWITDKFGVSWQIQPKLLIEMVTDKNPEKAKKAMAAMMTMVKIDCEALKKAWE